VGIKKFQNTTRLAPGFKWITKMCSKMIANLPLPHYRTQAKIGLHVGIKNVPEKYQAHFSGLADHKKIFESDSKHSPASP
jgi:hypothetical protein